MKKAFGVILLVLAVAIVIFFVLDLKDNELNPNGHDTPDVSDQENEEAPNIPNLTDEKPSDTVPDQPDPNDAQQPSQDDPVIDDTPDTQQPDDQPDDVPSVPNTVDVDAQDWNMILVNPWNKLPDGFTVELTELKNGHAVDKRAYPDLQQMMDDARADGLSPIICSSYRTNEKQTTLYTNQVNQYLSQGYSKEEAEKEAGRWVAVPGTSEHQTGLAVDIVDVEYQLLDEKQEETKVQKWLMENSYKYGFILRYPTDKGDITGIGYEPWHYRYVGKQVAKEIYDRGVCFEEYVQSLNAD